MPDPHPIELRARVVQAYEAGDGSYAKIAVRFCVGEASVKRWVRIYRRQGNVEPRRRAGGTPSEIDSFEIAVILMRDPDANADEITAAYNYRRSSDHRVHVSSIKRALHRHGYVVKKNGSGRWSSSGPTSRRSEPRT